MTNTEIERFDGFVNRISGDVAWITLVSPSGDQLCGEYPSDELASLGIHEGDRFSLSTVDDGGSVLIDIHAIPRRILSEGQLAAIREEVRRELGGYLTGDNSNGD